MATVDRTDGVPGRLVIYLEAALARVLPQLNGIATRALAAGIPHPEAAGLLAEAVGEIPVVLILDERERLEEAHEAWAVVEALVGYPPEWMRVVLVSRRDIPTAACALPPAGATAAIGLTEAPCASIVPG